MKLKTTKANSGQAIIIILLVVAVGLTVGISLISRTITDVRISRQEEEQARAFSTAEAGIEEAISQGLAPGETPLEHSFDDGRRYYVTATALGGERAFVFSGGAEPGDIKTVWLVGHDSDGNPLGDDSDFYRGEKIYIYWKDENLGVGDTDPALEATLIYEDKDSSDFKVSRAAFDPVGIRKSENQFFDSLLSDPPHSVTAGGTTYNFSFGGQMDIPDGCVPYALRLKLIYNTTAQVLGVEGDGSNNIPAQGTRYDSSATVAEGEGKEKVTSRVEQNQLYKAPPEIFDYLLFSEGDLEKSFLSY